ncbi:MAG: hypothetical protein CMJ18_03315 [Phycisphaeraceae bacterium]|nr:hypothetical protein [Phycisphaeraceae bacterium]
MSNAEYHHRFTWSIALLALGFTPSSIASSPARHEQLQSRHLERTVQPAIQVAQGAADAKRTFDELLQDADVRNRQRAAAGLAALGEPVETLMPLLRGATGHPEPWVRVAALRALGRAKDKEAVPAITDSLAAKEPKVRQAAAAALGVVDDPAAAALVKALDDEKPEVARTAALALAEFGTPVARAVLRAVATNSEHPARVWIAMAMHRLGEAGTQQRCTT